MIFVIWGKRCSTLFLLQNNINKEIQKYSQGLETRIPSSNPYLLKILCSLTNTWILWSIFSRLTEEETVAKVYNRKIEGNYTPFEVLPAERILSMPLYNAAY